MEQTEIIHVQAICGALSQQRNQALDTVAQLSAEIAALKEEISQLTQQLQAKDDMTHLAPKEDTSNE